ncbi:MAG: type II CAAX endopeptidase family protein [Longimicrobiales bacterium]|nr:type II CAAX endopeptidase family protein [Longimicrobiales bacterium]
MSQPYHASEDTRLPGPRSVLVFVLGLAVLFLFGGIFFQLLLGEGGLLAAEWLLLFLPALAWTGRSGFDPVRLLSLRTPTTDHLAAGLLLAAGALPLGWTLGWLQSFVLPVPVEVLEGLEEMVTAESPGRFLWLLLVVAATPAICEEVVFRGVLLGGTRSLTPWKMVLLNGAVFGAFHLSFSTVVRFLPTAALGCVIAWAVWRSGSIWVGMAMHFLNNATIVAMASMPALDGAFSDPYAPPPGEAVLAGGIAFALGAGILLRTSSPTEDRTTTPDEPT